MRWPCGHNDCLTAGAPATVSCRDCRRHLCGKHAIRPYHACTELTDDERGTVARDADMKELRFLFDKISSLDLASMAARLRPGVRFSKIELPHPAAVLRGGMNVHIPIEFEDGDRWYARIRQQRFDSPPPAMARSIMESEVETMRVLHNGGVCVPEVYLPASSSAAEDISVCFVSHMPGETCNAPLYGGLALNDCRRLIQSYALQSLKLAAIPFAGIGSLCPSGSAGRVGPFVSLDFCVNTPPYFLGPFQTNMERYLACIHLTLDNIRQRTNTGQGEAVNNDAEAIYYTHLWLRDTVQEVEQLGIVQPTYIKHADDKGDQILRNDTYDVTGIIDWEWAFTVPIAEAFAAPLAVVDVGAFFDGKNELSPYEIMLAEAYKDLGRADLAECVRGGRLYHRLAMTIGQPPDLVQLHALQALVRGDPGEEADIGEWVKTLKARYGT